MKKILAFMRSMKFGMILLALIMGVSFFGTLIQQGQSAEFYTTNYKMGELILTLGLDNLYYTPYFLGLGLLLILNLTLCSLVRFRSILGIGKKRVAASLKVDEGNVISDGQRKRLESYLEKKRYRKASEPGVTVYYKNQIGHLGSFFVHLSLVLLLFMGAVVLYTGKSNLYGIGYDAPAVLEDGTVVSLVDFTTEDENGEVHYESTLSIKTPDGEELVDKTSVNYPINHKGKKYFQETYGFATQLRIWNTVTEMGDEINLTEPLYLQTSEDGSGVYYLTAYTNYEEAEDGQIAVISEELEIGKPGVFLVTTMQPGADGQLVEETGLVTEGTTIQVGDIQFTFKALRAFPGIRIKETSRLAMAMLYATFGLMIAGLWFCFFQQPVYITVGKRGYYRITGVRNSEGLENELQMCMESEDK